MPPLLPPGASPGSAPSPVAGAGTSLPGQPPFGASPLTMPAPSRGNQNAARAAVRGAVGILQKAMGDAGIGTDLAEAINTALKTLSKHVQEGDVTEGAKKAQLQNFLLQQRSQGPSQVAAQLAAMRGPGAGAGPGGPAMPAAPGGPASPMGSPGG